MTTTGNAPGDRLARVLHALRMRGTFYCHAELGAPWALEMPAIPDSISFHVVTAGTCWLRLADHEPLELRAGDLALVPHGHGHDLSDSTRGPSGPRVDLLPQRYLTEHYSVLTHGGPGRSTQLVCGIVSFDDAVARDLVRALPTVLSIPGDSADAVGPFRDTLRLMAAELARPQPGGDIVATRLADVLVITAIRSWLTTRADTGPGWLNALQDERVGRVLEAIHAEPGKEWTLEGLARLATMSRSVFTGRFTELVGEPPIAYLTRWRMNVAHARLRDGDATVAHVATDLGYRSEAAFHRAFTRIIGTTPGAVRRGTAGVGVHETSTPSSGAR